MSNSKLDYIVETYPEVMLMDGFEDCIVGICERMGQEPIVTYDKNKIIDKMITEDGMTEEDALEFFYYNQIGAWVGDTTPCFVTIL